MRTLRFLLAAAIAVPAAAGCSSKGSSAPAVQPGKPAGDVRELAGSVTAHRGSGEPRALKVGDEVSGDDVIVTGADGSVVIELRHNGVRWSLGAGQEKQVSTSAAWQAPRGGGGSIDDRSTAAGRHAEREAADTAENAVATTESAPAPGGSPPASAVVAQPPAAERMAAKREAPPPPSPVEAPKSAPPEPPPPTVEPTAAVAAVAAAQVTVGTVNVDDTIDAGLVGKALGNSAALTACWQRGLDAGVAAGTLTLSFTIGESGAVSDVHATGIGGDVPGCVEKVVKKLKFAKPDAENHVIVALELD